MKKNYEAIPFRDFMRGDWKQPTSRNYRSFSPLSFLSMTPSVAHGYLLFGTVAAVAVGGVLLERWLMQHDKEAAAKRVGNGMMYGIQTVVIGGCIFILWKVISWF